MVELNNEFRLENAPIHTNKASEYEKVRRKLLDLTLSLINELKEPQYAWMYD